MNINKLKEEGAKAGVISAITQEMNKRFDNLKHTAAAAIGNTPDSRSPESRAESNKQSLAGILRLYTELEALQNEFVKETAPPPKIPRKPAAKRAK